MGVKPAGKVSVTVTVPEGKLSVSVPSLPTNNLNLAVDPRVNDGESASFSRIRLGKIGTPGVETSVEVLA
jgi:hypothetical protein